jgi:hypothetical protein
MQRDFMQENELEKCRALLEGERREKMKLVAVQGAWREERAKLLEERDVMLFALQSLKIELDIHQPHKKPKQTTKALKNNSRTSLLHTDKLGTKAPIASDKHPQGSKAGGIGVLLENMDGEGNDDGGEWM